MSRNMSRNRRFLLTPLLVLLLAVPMSAAAADAEVGCTLHYSMHGWSVFYSTASGSGVVECADGQRMQVALEATGGGITFGVIDIADGTGKFSGIYDIREVLGTYATAEAHAGAVKSAKAQVLTKGNVSLALTGLGDGWNVGVSFGAFTISPR